MKGSGYVCMCMCMYVCLYVYMDVWMYVCGDALINPFLNQRDTQTKGHTHITMKRNNPLETQLHPFIQLWLLGKFGFVWRV